MEKEKSLQRICTSCGLPKLLSAFLYISSTRGTTYGSICSACRSAGKGFNKKNKTEEDSGSTTLRLRIGAEEKIHFEKEWARKIKEKNQEALEEKKKKEKTHGHKEDAAQKEGHEKIQQQLNTSERPAATSSPPTGVPPIPPPVKPESVADGAPLTPEKKKEWVRQKSQQEQKLEAGASSFTDSAQTTVTRHISDVHRGFLEFLGESSAAASQLIKNRRAKAQQLFTTGKTENKVSSQQLFPAGKAETNTSDNVTPDVPENKIGFQKKK